MLVETALLIRIVTEILQSEIDDDDASSGFEELLAFGLKSSAINVVIAQQPSDTKNLPTHRKDDNLFI